MVGNGVTKLKPLRCPYCNKLLAEHYIQGKGGELILKCRGCKNYTLKLPYEVNNESK